MKVVGKFPSYAVRNADFVTGRRKEGRVVDFQVELETLPAHGMLCVHEDTIIAAVKKLGYEIRKDDEVQALADAETKVVELTDELDTLRRLVHMMKAEGFVEAEPVAT